MDQTFACQFALAYRSPMLSAGKPHGAIDSLHIATPPLQAPRTDDIRRVATGVPQLGIRPSRRGISPETQMPFIRSPCRFGYMLVVLLITMRIFIGPLQASPCGAAGFARPRSHNLLIPPF